MKHLLLVLMATLSVTQAYAFQNLQCTGDNGESLTITHKIYRVTYAQATLVVGGETAVFSGVVSGSGVYSVTGSNGEKVSLWVTKLTSPGNGRCGRCAFFPADEDKYFAKLIVDSVPMNFSCEPLSSN
jgi:hypothetical protein